MRVWSESRGGCGQRVREGVARVGESVVRVGEGVVRE